jgi:cytochrome c7-like protein
MAQIFTPHADSCLRGIIVATVLLICGAGWLASEIVWSPYSTYVNVPFEQPVPFSHKHHVGDDGIDCRYCHNSVEKSSFAGMPGSATCMACHSQLFATAPVLAPVRQSLVTNKPLQWNRVHDLPDYVYFNHSIHVAKGIGCSSCHGRVDQMPLTRKTETLYMKWCLECHRQPEHFVRPPDQIYNMAWIPAQHPPAERERLVSQYRIDTSGRLTDCSTCHR